MSVPSQRLTASGRCVVLDSDAMETIHSSFECGEVFYLLWLKKVSVLLGVSFDAEKAKKNDKGDSTHLYAKPFA